MKIVLKSRPLSNAERQVRGELNRLEEKMRANRKRSRNHHRADPGEWADLFAKWTKLATAFEQSAGYRPFLPDDCKIP